MQPILLLGEQLLVCLAILSFLLGFISIHPGSTVDESSSSSLVGYETPKVVLMVIDGLRRDHILSMEADLDTGGTSSLTYLERMPYVAQQLNKMKNKGMGGSKQQGKDDSSSGGALAFEVVTSSPTVTAPRLQSLVSGIIPGYLSMATNFGASSLLVQEDSLVHRWKRAGRRIRMYGDDTWLKMFPNTFDHADPVTSFFVSDFYEVDRNVSRNLPSLLSHEGLAQWDVAILHYLGLDHIGHVHGANHELIRDKLLQMNDVVLRVHQALVASGSPFVFLVCGDHGMLDEGGHGGARYEELHTAAALFTSHRMERRSSESYVIRQVDLAGTMGVLSGVGPPAAGVGVPVLSTLRGVLDPLALYTVYKDEARRLLGMLRTAALPADDASALVVEAEWLEAQHMDLLHQITLDAAGHSTGGDNTTGAGGKLQSVPLSPSSAATLLQLQALYHTACSKASDVLVDRMRAYDLPVLVPSAAVIALIASARVVHSFLSCSLASSSSSLARTKLSSVALTGGACSSAVIVAWAMGCGLVGGATQLCQPTASWPPWLLLLPAVYGVLLWCLIFRRLMAAVAMGSSVLTVTRCLPSPGKRSGLFLTRALLVGGSLAHSLSLLGSSFVEEEHQTYYFLHTSLQTALLVLAAVVACSVTATSVRPEQRDETDAAGGAGGRMSGGEADSVLQRRNDALRVKMKSVYDNYSVNPRQSSTVENLLGEADGILNDVLTKSNDEKQRSKRRSDIINKLVVACLCLLLSLILFRVSRTWNATGDKWKHLPDLSLFVRGLPVLHQRCLLLLAVAVAVAAANLCVPVVLFGFVHVYCRHYPIVEHSVDFASMCVYGSACVLLLYGFCRNWYLSHIFVRIGSLNVRATNFLALVGILNVTQAARLNARNKTPLPTTAPFSKSSSLTHSLEKSGTSNLNFSQLSEKYNSNRFLISEILRYLHWSLAMLWLLLQRQDNVLLCVMLLVQSRLFTAAVLRMAQSGVSGVSDGGRREASLLYRMPNESVGDTPSVSGVASLGVLWMAQAFFFAQGNSNSLSSIHLAAGFVGVQHYHPLLHGALIALHTLGAPLLALLHHLQQLLQHDTSTNGVHNATYRSVLSRVSGQGWWRAVAPTMRAWWCLRLWCLGVYAVNVVLQRDHLFIWSVYTPKLVYECAHLALLLLINVLLVVLAAVAS